MTEYEKLLESQIYNNYRCIVEEAAALGLIREDQKQFYMEVFTISENDDRTTEAPCPTSSGDLRKSGFESDGFCFCEKCLSTETYGSSSSESPEPAPSECIFRHCYRTRSASSVTLTTTKSTDEVSLPSLDDSIASQYYGMCMDRPSTSSSIGRTFVPVFREDVIICKNEDSVSSLCNFMRSSEEGVPNVFNDKQNISDRQGHAENGNRNDTAGVSPDVNTANSASNEFLVVEADGLDTESLKSEDSEKIIQNLVQTTSSSNAPEKRTKNNEKILEESCVVNVKKPEIQPRTSYDFNGSDCSKHELHVEESQEESPELLHRDIFMSFSEDSDCYSQSSEDFAKFSTPPTKSTSDSFFGSAELSREKGRRRSKDDTSLDTEDLNPFRELKESTATPANVLVEQSSSKSDSFILKCGKDRTKAFHRSGDDGIWDTKTNVSEDEETSAGDATRCPQVEEYSIECPQDDESSTQCPSVERPTEDATEQTEQDPSRDLPIGPFTTMLYVLAKAPVRISDPTNYSTEIIVETLRFYPPSAVGNFNSRFYFEFWPPWNQNAENSFGHENPPEDNSESSVPSGSVPTSEKSEDSKREEGRGTQERKKKSSKGIRYRFKAFRNLFKKK